MKPAIQPGRALRSTVALPIATLFGLLPQDGRTWGNLLLLEAPPAQTAWSAGGSLWSLPKFPGAAPHQTTLLPAFEWRDHSGRFISTDSGVGWNFSRDKGTQFGARLWPHLGRRSGDVPAGVGTIGPRLQAEAYANHAPFEALLLQSGLLLGSGLHHDGAQLELGLTSGLPIGDDLLGIGLSTTWANGPYRRSYFGLAEAQSVASGLPAYDPGAGWTDRSLTLSFEHRFTPHWRFDVQSYRVWLASRITASPLNFSRGQQAATVSIWHDF